VEIPSAADTDESVSGVDYLGQRRSSVANDDYTGEQTKTLIADSKPKPKQKGGKTVAYAADVDRGTTEEKDPHGHKANSAIVQINVESESAPLMGQVDNDGDNSETLTRSHQPFSSSRPTQGAGTDVDAEADRSIEAQDYSSTNVADADSKAEVTSVGKRSKMDEKKRAMLMQQMRDTFRRLLSDGSFKADDLFNHLDEDGDGELTAPEIFEGLSCVPGFEEVTEEQVIALVRSTAGESRDWISMDEFKDFVKSESKRGAVGTKDVRGGGRRRGKAAQRTTRAAGKKASKAAKTNQTLPKHATPAEFAAGVRATFKKTVQDGFSLDELFIEMDADGDGQISSDELQAILVRFKYFKNVTVEQVEELLTAIHQGQEGDVSIEEFKHFLEIEERNAAATMIQMFFRRAFPNDHRFKKHQQRQSQPQKQQKDKPFSSSDKTGANGQSAKTDHHNSHRHGGLSSHKDSHFVAKCRGLFRRMVKSGVTVETLFSQIDIDSDGELSLDELRIALGHHPTFHILAGEDVSALIDMIDKDGNGLVDIEEFRQFIQSEKKHAGATMLQAQFRRRQSWTDRDALKSRHHTHGTSAKAHSTVTSQTTESSFRVGDRVEAQFGGGASNKYYSATVQAVVVAANGTSSYDLLYDDGDNEKSVTGDKIRAKSSHAAEALEDTPGCRLSSSPGLNESSVYSDDFEQ